MKVIPFIAHSVPEAVTKIRRQLGPDAVVLNVRQINPGGISKLWRQPRIEVLACRPEAKSSLPNLDASSNSEVLRALIREVQSIKRAIHDRPTSDASPAIPPQPATQPDPHPHQPVTSIPAADEWRIAEVLEATGLLPVHALRVVELLRARHGEQAPKSFEEELTLARHVLRELWRESPQFSAAPDKPHILIGPAGTGKTTALCKWLTQAVLVEDEHPMVWRLDGTRANTAEMLGIYGEILGLPVERTWTPNTPHPTSPAFLDLPGIEWWNVNERNDLYRKIEELGPTQLHLVLNIAYEMPQIMAQVQAYNEFAVQDIIVTHLDEELRWGKIWNLVMGTNIPVRFLNAGQNIPGDFTPATPEKIFPRQFPAE